jgi:hypothetical protein
MARPHVQRTTSTLGKQVLIRLDSSISIAPTVDQSTAQFVEDQHEGYRRTASPRVATASRVGRKDMTRLHLSYWFILIKGFLAHGLIDRFGDHC